VTELKPEQLRRKIDLSSLGIRSSKDIKPLEGMLGQERAEEALSVGLGIDERGYNIFIGGIISGDGSEVIDLIRQNMPQEEPSLHDLVYVNNFVNPKEPRLLQLLPGQGIKLRDGISELVDSLPRRITLVFESEEYKEGVKQVQNKYQPIGDEISLQMRELAVSNPDVFHIRKISQSSRAESEEGGDIESDEDIDESIEEVQMEERVEEDTQGKDTSKDKENKRDKEDISKQESGYDSEKLSRNIDDSFKFDELKRKLEEVNKDGSRELKEFRNRLCEVEIEELILTLKKKLYEHSFNLETMTEALGDTHSSIALEAFFDELKRDILDNVDDFAEKYGKQPKGMMIPGVGLIVAGGDSEENLKYKVNVLVDNSGKTSPPIIYEAEPNFKNLFGRIELGFHPMSGERKTDFTKINQGALHRAKGGYLILDVLALLREPFAYDKLMSSLKAGRATIEASPLSFLDTSLKPDPCDIKDVKVIFTGDRGLYELLHGYDPDFGELFRIRADIETDIEINNNNSMLMKYLGYVSRLRSSSNLSHFNTGGLSAIVEYAMRMAHNQEKASLLSDDVNAIMVEADFWARSSGSKMITDMHVEKAIKSKDHRSRRYIDRLNEMTRKGKFMVDTTGEKVGQINSLVVYEIGDCLYGNTYRVTAVTSVGKKGVVHIERETHQSGSVHDKGVCTLEGYIHYVFGQNKRLAFNASITFEQTYGGIDGDSASSTELYALLSSLSGVPIKQGIAVTGSVNQFGEVQVIGGVNEKIEGFFEVCRQSKEGLTGEQGVIIPYKNATDLMLRRDIIKAVEEGKFHIYTVKTIGEGIEILTGQKAGSNTEEGTVYYKANKRLAEMAKSDDEAGEFMSEIGELLDDKLSGGALSDNMMDDALERVINKARKGKSVEEKINGFKSALSMIDSEIKLDPNNLSIHVRKAYILMETASELSDEKASQVYYSDAIKILERVVGLNEDSLEANLALGMIYANLDEYEKAINHINKVIENDNTLVEAYQLRMKLNAVLGRHKDALSDANRLIKLSQSVDSDFYISMGILNVKIAESDGKEDARNRLNRLEEAVKCYESAAALSPEYVMPVHNIARTCHYGLNDHDRAITNYKWVVERVDKRYKSVFDLIEKKSSDKEIREELERLKGAEQDNEAETLKEVLKDGIIAVEALNLLGCETPQRYVSLASESGLLTQKEIKEAIVQAGTNHFSK